jgi:hypothetical protein
MICLNCSNPVDSNTKFCPYCDAPIEETFESKASTGIPVSRRNQLAVLTSRYKDAYVVSSVTEGFGRLIKALGVLIAGVLVLVGFLLIGQGGLGEATFALGVVILIFGIVTGLSFYMWGVLVSANAQVLKASLDSAVNTSPFLSNEHRAEIMSLPQA